MFLFLSLGLTLLQSFIHLSLPYFRVEIYHTEIKTDIYIYIKLF